MSSTRSPSRPAPATERREAALLLVGLGSSREGGAEALFAHAASLKARGCFAEAAVGFITASPGIEAAFGALSAPVVYVVPFLMCDGYLAQAKIPAALAPLAAPGRDVRLCAPVGTDPRMAALLADRAMEICAAEALDPAIASVVVVGHGTPGSSASSAAVRAHVARLAASGDFESVQPAFLQEAPLLADVLAEATAPTIVVGLFAGRGMHWGEDVPRLIERARAHRAVPILDAGPIGTHPGCAALVLAAADRIDARAQAASAA
jgi:sirohydrochlorin cobaltochelatase